MTKIMRLSHVLVALFALLLPTLPAQAAPMTFVASTGNDSNACTLAAPCLTFVNAVVKTDSGGVIKCLDSGPFVGSATIFQTLTIDCAGGTYMPGLVFVGLEIPSATVTLTVRNMVISGAGGAGVGLHCS